MTVTYVCRLLPLTCLALDIVEAIPDGRQPKGLRLAEMLGNGPLAWNVQTETWGFRMVRSRAALVGSKLNQTAGNRNTPGCNSQPQDLLAVIEIGEQGLGRALVRDLAAVEHIRPIGERQD